MAGSCLVLSPIKLGVKNGADLYRHLFTLFRPVSLYARSTTFRAFTFCGALGMGGMWTSGAALIAETGDLNGARGGALMQMGFTCWRYSGYQPDGNRQLGQRRPGAGCMALSVYDRRAAGIHYEWSPWFTPESQVWLARQQAKATSRQPAVKLGKQNLRGLLLAFVFIFYSVSVLGRIYRHPPICGKSNIWIFAQPEVCTCAAGWGHRGFSGVFGAGG